MDRFVKLPDANKNEAYRLAAEKAVNLPEDLIEKDFWVCWTLQELFAVEELKDNLIFKGGTTLSKVYAVIERFSEDIDLAIEKSFFGMTGDKDPAAAPSYKKACTLIDELSGKCQEYIKEKLLPTLEKRFKAKLIGNWKLELDPGDPDGQTILFYYPKLTKNNSIYVRPTVKIELGSRAEHFPSSPQKISPYVAGILPDTFKDMCTLPKVLEVERTFWEKATILHYYANYPAEKALIERQSRHYYDFYQLLRSKHKEAAVQKVDLLEIVSKHKLLYFRNAWAKYETAIKGTLKLIPDSRVNKFMEKDYQAMAEMFVTDAPAWAEVIQAISAFEMEFNSK